MHPAYTGAILLGAIGAVAYSIYCCMTSQNTNTPHYYEPHVSDWNENPIRGNDRGYRCTICHDTEEGALVNLRCKHRFHQKCIQRWRNINQACPICRCRF